VVVLLEGLSKGRCWTRAVWLKLTHRGLAGSRICQPGLPGCQDKGEALLPVAEDMRRTAIPSLSRLTGRPWSMVHGP
jgi:hypothetical protein